ncbi:DNA mismatch repair endonuclease MutL [Patescibacteria group bacterium]|nr:DNA mismatch repair endonuclease MutL [Patescibacteria group bacterium]
MGKIIFLPKEVVAKTAAGEVIENPASVVKELVENSLDAGARSIKILVKEGGKQKIVVADDGEGISKDDLLICYKPHSSGKIKEERDLDRIVTFGFRGEALNSISCVSEFKIRSFSCDCSEEQNGWEISGSFGKIPNNSLVPVGMSQGTVVEVENLFANFPARKKFLKSGQAEFQKIKNLILLFILAHPQVSFSLIHNETAVFEVSAHYNLEQRLALAFGHSDSFLPLRSEKEHFSFNGFLSLPQKSSDSFKDLYLYINKRPIKWEKALQKVRKAYGTLLEKYQYPKGVLFLDIPPELVDVNVHPRKEEVRLKNEADVLLFIENSVRGLLEQNNLTYSFSNISGLSESLYGVLKDSFSPWQVDLAPDPDSLEEVLQVAQTYLVASFRDKILLLDQHAAHEKILYAQILDQLNNGIGIKNLVLDCLETENFNSGEIFAEENIGILGEHSEEISHVASTLACKSAVKAGDFLPMESRIRLVKKLLDTHLEKYTCPHGRPTMIELSKADLDRLFRRV